MSSSPSHDGVICRVAMKILPAVRAWCRQHGASSSYLLFALFMLHLARRGSNRHIVAENVITFTQALVPTELAHKLLALNAGVVWWLAKKVQTPMLDSWTGSFAAFCQGLAVLKFLEYHRSNVDAKHFIRSALAKSDIDPRRLLTIGDMTLAQWLCVLLPLPQPLALTLAYPGVHKTRTVTYAHVGGNRTTRLRMDVYKHTTATPANAPIFLYVHGGAWVVGTRERPPMPLIYQVASRGWIVCSVDYRLSPKVAFPDHLIDVKRAIAYLRKNARGQFNANPDFIVVGGESAGGHLASLVALTPTDKSLQPGFEDVDTSVCACVDNYGVHDIKDRHGIYYYKDKSNGFVRYMELIVMQKKLIDADLEYEVASPISWLMDDKLQDAKQGQIVPPFMVSHGTHDTLVPFDDSHLFYEHLQRYRQRSTRQPVVDDIFIELPGVHHGFNYLMSPRALAYGDAVCAFLENLHTKSKSAKAINVQDAAISTVALVTPRGASRL